jgi:hypothetical protein
MPVYLRVVNEITTLIRTGQLESTILSSYVQAAQLKAWLSRDECPPAIKECQALFRKAFAPPGDLEHGDSNEAFRHTQPCSTPDDLRTLISQRSITLHARYSVNGVVYARNSTHVGNSLIIYHAGGDNSRPAVPGSIKYIFGIDGKISLAVQRQNVVPDGTFDPFCHYPHFPARVYSDTTSVTLERVEPGWILSHYVRWSFTPGYVVVLTLFRVSSGPFQEGDIPIHLIVGLMKAVVRRAQMLYAKFLGGRLLFNPPSVFGVTIVNNILKMRTYVVRRQNLYCYVFPSDTYYRWLYSWTSRSRTTPSDLAASRLEDIPHPL